MNCTDVTSSLGCWLKSDGSTETVGVVREYRTTESGEILLYKTRYARPDGTLITPGVGEAVTAGACAVAQQPLSAPGALLSANICVGSPIFVPSGNRDDVRTVGTGGTYANFVAAMADVTVVDGTVLRAVSNVTETATVNVNRAVVIDLDGFTHSNATSVTQFNVTAALAVIKDGTVHHSKVANTSVETAIAVNTTTGPAFVVDNIIKVQEFGVNVQGGAMISGNTFEYAGASQTNSHRFIALYKITTETKIDDNEFTCSTIPSTTRYSNFVFMSAIAGSTWTAPLWVTRNRQTGGSLRQFVFNEALVPTTGSQLIVAANYFNDFNGGIGLVSPALYNGLDKIAIVDNHQGGDAAGNFKGVFFVDGTGTLDNDTEFVYGGNITAAGALRADYVSLASDTDNIVARKNTIVAPTEPAVEIDIRAALEATGLLLQDIKGRRTYVVDSKGVPLDGFGTKTDPYKLPEIPTPEIVTTSIEPVVFDTAWVGAQADDVGNLAKAVELSTGTILSSGLVTWTAHGLTIGETYYTSQTVAGEFVTPEPSTGISQKLFTVVDADTILIQVQEGVEFVDEVENTPVLQMVTDEAIVATNGLAGFTLTRTPLGSVAVFLKGIRLPKAAVSVVGSVLTYIPAENNNNELKVGDRITFDYIAQGL